MNVTPKVGQVLIDEFGGECMVVSVRNDTKNFMVNGQWFPFSYIGYAFHVQKDAKESEGKI